MDKLQIFSNPDFGEIRTLVEPDGTVLMCGSDAAKALGYARPSEAVADHCRCTVKRRIPHPQSPDKTIEMNFITKGDLCRLAAKSELPGADKFESWIFDEVIPSVLEHGAYLTPEKIEEVLSDPDTIISIAMRLKEERAKNKLLINENAQQKQIIAEFSPKASYYDVVLQTKDVISAGKIAKDYGKSAQWLNKLLHEKCIQFKQGGVWLLYQKYAEQGYTKTKTEVYSGSDGEQHSKPHTYWTQKGRLFIYDTLKAAGFLPLMEQEINKARHQKI